MSTTRSLMTEKPSNGSIVTRSPTSPMSTLQARRLRPLMRIASDPQMPCAQERRYVSVPSSCHFTWLSASSTRSSRSTSTLYSRNAGFSSSSGLYRLMRSVTSTASPFAGIAEATLVHPLFWFECRDRYRFLGDGQLFAVFDDHRMGQPIGIVPLFEVGAVVRAAALISI